MALDDAFRSRSLTAPLVEQIARQVRRPLRFMEVCGTHTMSIFQHGIRSLLPPEITLLSGPGCPVCVTPAGHIDAFVEAAQRPGVIVATFGDLIRVPGSAGSLATARTRGARVEIVYSPMDALGLAAAHPEQIVLFPGIGFETTAPTLAATVLAAAARGLDNFVLFPAAKRMPPVLSTLLADPELHLDGLLCPGHVSAVIGSDAYRPFAESGTESGGLPCAVAGFEPADILAGLLALVRQVNAGRPRVDNCYPRAVSAEGNPRALELIDRVFVPVDSEWRGLGKIAASGLALRDAFRRFDAVDRLGLHVTPVPEPKGCRCGDMLKGRLQPPDCPLYARACTPLNPVGPCMVSGEGTCAAFYRYNRSSKQASSSFSSTQASP
ncbi:MAG: hydrogenase formation protein HypD [Desulfobulbus sp.]|jgi:hydrogenase expression/formation protein HypD